MPLHHLLVLTGAFFDGMGRICREGGRYIGLSVSKYVVTTEGLKEGDSDDDSYQA
jgi:hypothetical protein